MFTFINLIACSGSFTSAISSTPVVAPDELDIGVQETPADSVVPAHADREQLTIELPAVTGRTVQVVPYRSANGAIAWTGRPLVSEVVDETFLTVTLPSRVLASHRERGSDDVVYSIALRETLEDGSPGMYLGISDAQLVWSEPTETEDGGWSSVLRYGTEDEQVLDIADTVAVWENIQSPDVAAIGGFNNVLVPDTHIVLSSCYAGGCVSAFDAPVGPDSFSIELDGAPGVGEGMFALETYLDADGDNRLTEEEPNGVGCLGQEAVVMTWYPSAYDLQDALAMKEIGGRAGWEVWLDTKDGLVGVQPEYRGNIVLSATCEAAQ